MSIDLDKVVANINWERYADEDPESYRLDDYLDRQELLGGYDA